MVPEVVVTTPDATNDDKVGIVIIPGESLAGPEGKDTKAHVIVVTVSIAG